MKKRWAPTLALLRLGFYLGLLVIAYFVLRRLSSVLVPVGTGLLLAYLLNPSVTRLQRRGLPRVVGVILLLAGFAAVVTAALLFIPPLVGDEVRSFSERWHQYQARLESSILPWVRSSLHLPRGSSLHDVFLGAISRLGAVVKDAPGDLTTAASRTLAAASGVLRGVGTALLVPVFAVYFLLDYPALAAEVTTLVPPRHRDRVLSVAADVNHALGHWIRGQLSVMAVLGVGYAVGLGISGIPLGIGIGLLTGLLAFIPYVGVIVGFVLALLLGILDYHGPGAIIGVFITFATVQTLDAFVITPRIVGGKVGLSAITIIFALGLGGALLGYVGLLLAVPGAAVAKVLLARARAAYLASDYYLGQPAPPTDGDEDGQRAR